MTNDRQIETDHIDDATEAQKARLLNEMDITMVQKLAFASAHFQLHDGARILDIGCARGKGSYHIAALNPRLQVVGIDYDQDFIDEASRTYQLPNLSYIQGDARKLKLEDEKFDAIFNSSVMHEIYSFSNYDPKAVTSALRAQLNHLKPGGITLFRDFMRAAEPDAMVYLDLPPEDHTGTEPVDMSYADLLRYYAQIADTMKPEELQGFFLEDLGDLPDGWRRFYLSKDRAYEFIWRKEYRERFAPEAREKYAVWTAEQYRDIPESLGARVVYTAPYRNPWIVRNWHENKFRLFDENMKPLMGPPSNFIAVVQKAGRNKSLRLREHRAAGNEASYLQLEHFKNAKTESLYDLVSRPGAVYDIIPYGHNDRGNLVVYAKSGYPRPLINIHARQMTENLDGRTWSGHMVEPLAIANEGNDLDSVVHKLLKERTAFKKRDIGKIEKGMSYFTAPADVNEKVSSAFVEVDAGTYESKLKGHFSGFSSDGSVRAYDIQDLLRGVQVGMLAEARLEMNIYALLRRLNACPEDWIGDRYNIAGADVPEVFAFNDLKTKDRKIFVKTNEQADYLKVLRSVFVDEAVNGLLATQELEFSVPVNNTGKQDISTNSAMAIPVVRDKNSGEVMMGVEIRDFPAVQVQDGHSGIVTVTGYRLPSAVRNLDNVKAFLQERFEGADIHALGESYFPSMGILPNRIFPYLVTNNTLDEFEGCKFVPLRDLFKNLDQLQDAHLILAVCRAVHALGLWEEYSPEHENKVGLTLAS